MNTVHTLAKFDRRYASPVLGADEVGTGSWAGPVFVAAVVLPDDREIVQALCAAGVDDSKKLSTDTRERLFEFIVEQCIWYSARSVSSAELDRRGQSPCLDSLFEGVLYDGLRGPCPKTLLVDGSPRTLPWSPTFIPRADSLSLAVATASVVAKVLRDREMRRLAVEFPGYGWDHNAGYGTQDHKQAIQRYGLTTHHRRGVRPIRAYEASEVRDRTGG